MTNCPDCKEENVVPTKTWKYGQFTVDAYLCKKCNTQFNEYVKKGKHAFTLKRKDGGYRYSKA